MSEATRTKVRIRILSEEHTISGQLPADEMREAAEYVNRTLAQLSASSSSSSVAGLAILAAINIANELLEMQRRVQTLEATIQGGTQQMLALLEARTDALAAS